jgi:hypothetical protein
MLLRAGAKSDHAGDDQHDADDDNFIDTARDLENDGAGSASQWSM